ncbi:MAG: thymidine phosphorylase [Chiayiivirga sp.]|uniref:thymidine phosphorylase n=1 Tax=Chiayiivirga sp. TaxID=2041042 RepID=UPI0025C2D9FA|nr:thymidine phosphorylase [Chiayiivirga sp.]MCI1709739.1 thymidine phosphorylase [Chiayiivirga sp.]MCI1729958.1 thymidine phosphorylase [Chiayiivirga sp.]
MNVASPASLIGRKRTGEHLTPAQLAAVANGIGNGQWSEGQVAAFAMAVAWRGMGADECRAFTLALRDSGRQLRWSHLPGPVLDKHSTGGVGDGVSLVLAPLVAACGGFVPMISGRGLGHTGGTLDKLESIPGYHVNPSPERLRRVVSEVGCAIVGQSEDLVPADRRLYAIRDVTATVDVPDLIVASILSKKLASGAEALVLDVKTGNGAQLPSLSAACDLADRMLAVAQGSGLRLRVALSDMRQVLGREAGNALEVQAALDILCGRCRTGRLFELSLALAAELLVLGQLAIDRHDATRRLTRALASGAAAERFQRMVTALGGPSDLLEGAAAHLPQAPVQRMVLASADGYIGMIDVRALGQVVVQLGGGRSQAGARIDPAVGLSNIVGRGERMLRGEPLLCIHARTEAAAEQAAEQVRGAFALGDVAPPPDPLIRWYAAPREQAA